MAADIRRGTWSEPELSLIHHAVRQGETVVDVGANYGLWTYHLSKAVGSGGRVLAFEPVPSTAAVLKWVVGLLRLKNVELRAAACGVSGGQIDMVLPVQDAGPPSAGQAHFADRSDDRPGHESHVRWTRSRTVKVDVVALDEAVRHKEVTFIKCDVEGAEPMVLQGAAVTLGRSRPTLVVEINPWFLEGFGSTTEQLLVLLSSHGYQGYRLDDRAGRLVPIGDQLKEDNYVFVHPSRLPRLEPLL